MKINQDTEKKDDFLGALGYENREGKRVYIKVDTVNDRQIELR